VAIKLARLRYSSARASQFSVNMRVSKSFGIGPPIESTGGGVNGGAGGGGSVGVLESPLFGTSNALSGVFFSSPAANRSIDLQMTFSS
jgi:hypothetical protein